MKHLEEIQESYLKHGVKALKFCLTLLGLAFICFIHAFIPCCFTETVSNKLEQLLKEMKRMSDDYNGL